MRKIPVRVYTEITSLVNINNLELGGNRYLTNEGGKLYLVEVLVK